MSYVTLISEEPCEATTAGFRSVGEEDDDRSVLFPVGSHQTWRSSLLPLFFQGIKVQLLPKNICKKC